MSSNELENENVITAMDGICMHGNIHENMHGNMRTATCADFIPCAKRAGGWAEIPARGETHGYATLLKASKNHLV